MKFMMRLSLALEWKLFATCNFLPDSQSVEDLNLMIEASTNAGTRSDHECPMLELSLNDYECQLYVACKNCGPVKKLDHLDVQIFNPGKDHSTNSV